MELFNFRVLQTLLEDPHLSRAAARLHLTQSALSKRVQAIEAEVGRPLFERRGPRGLKPLPPAHELARIAGQISAAWETGLKKVQRAADEPDHFRLVGPSLFLREVILPWWTGSAAKRPELALEAKPSPVEKISIAALRFGADAAILEHREELADFVCKPFYKEVWGIIRHPKTKPGRLADYRWGTYSATNNLVDSWLVRRGKMANPRYHLHWSDLTALVIWVAETPDAASVVPWHAAAWMAKRGRVAFEPLGRDAITPLYLAYPRDTRFKPMIDEMLRFSASLAHEKHAKEW